MNKRRIKHMSGILTGIFLFSIIFGGCNFDIKEAKADLSGNNVVINEISIDSIDGTGGTEDDWVELYNPTDTVISLDDWSIQKTSGTGSSFGRISLSGSIPAHGYFLVVRSSATSTFTSIADITSSSLSLSTNNIVYLVNNNENISSTTNPYIDENIVDFIGFGSASFFEGSSTAVAIPDGKSISRNPDSNDTDNNHSDFGILDVPTPRNSNYGETPFENIGGTVLITVAPDTDPVRNITPVGAEIFFQINDNGQVAIDYGLDDSYSSSTSFKNILAGTDESIPLAGLTCSTTYHYEIYAEDINGTESDQSEDATFTTLPCGIAIDSLVMTKASARAKNIYEEGWEWEFGLTIWDLNETSLKMKFNRWSGANFLDAAANMKYSADNGVTWVDIDTNAAYPSQAIDISAIDNNSSAAGRQVEILVRMKVPFGTSAGYYNSGYGILTE